MPTLGVRDTIRAREGIEDGVGPQLERARDRDGTGVGNGRGGLARLIEGAGRVVGHQIVHREGKVGLIHGALVEGGEDDRDMDHVDSQRKPFEKRVFGSQGQVHAPGAEEDSPGPHFRRSEYLGGWRYRRG